MKWKIAILEIAILLGILISAFLLPGSFPLSWFIAISLGVLVAANAVLFNALNRTRVNVKTGYRMGARAYLGLALIVAYWILTFLYHRHR